MFGVVVLNSLSDFYFSVLILALRHTEQIRGAILSDFVDVLC